MSSNPITRRLLCQFAAGSTLAASGFLGASAPQPLVQRVIPSSGQKIHAIGMGTWQTFNVGSDSVLRKARTEVLNRFFLDGGQLIDSSPMYGSSQDVIGYGLDRLDFPAELFAADKVWTSDGDQTRAQIQESARLWQINKFALMQVHNLLNWQAHLPKLQQMKRDGQLQYLGITTSHGRRHDEFERVMQDHDLDFIQLTYNLTHREAEQRLLPLAREKGIAVIANRPFDGGYLVDRLQRNNFPLPPWAADIQCVNWPQFLLKYIISHPAITCAIPATTKVAHMVENMGAARGDLPDANMREKMLKYVQQL